MRCCVLGSGSRGNATLIEAGGTRLLLDCGFAAKELEKRAEAAGVEPASIDAILVTHEHGDHIRGVGAVARRYDIPVWATNGTLRKGKTGKLSQVFAFNAHCESFSIGDVDVQPVPVPHDATEPCQFVFSSSNLKLGILTDLGCITPQINRAFAELDMLLLECNHDSQMLAEGPYPPALQARVGGNLGHLNNYQASSLLKHINSERLRYLLLGHLSEKNNHPERVRQTINSQCEQFEDRFEILKQDEISPWYGI